MKMNIKKTKVGDKVFIKEGLVPGKYYGAMTYEKGMVQGWCEVLEIFSKSGIFSVKTDNGDSWEFLYSYSPEMVDWNKTIKSRRKKMNINDLKVGDVVYIREDLEDDKKYGNNVYIDDMCKGIQEIGLVSSENGIIRTVETPDYSYTPEMIDWEKTRKLQKNNCYNFEKITQYGECGNEMTKAIICDGREIMVKNNNEENDIEKAVMMLMLKSIGITYGDVKKEVEKVNVKWMPTEDDRYYYIREIGDISSCFWNELAWDYYRFDFNNCFRTREEAEKKLEKIKEVLKGE